MQVDLTSLFLVKALITCHHTYFSQEISTDARISTVWFTLATGNDAPTNIFWDPSLGYGAVNEGSSGLNLASPAVIAIVSSGLAVMVVAAVAVVVVIIVLRRKRKVPGDVSKDVYAPIA